MEDAFKAFAKFGNPKSDGKQITLSNSDKWMKQAGVIDGKKISTIDTAICFNKFRSKALPLEDFVAYVEQLAKEKGLEPRILVERLVNCKKPGAAKGATVTVKSNAVDRLTDTTKYTGSHKARFDAEGKGRGIRGRENVAENSGYVSGYSRDKSYDATHK